MNVGGWNTVQASDIDKYNVDFEELQYLGIEKVRIGGTDPAYTNATATVKALALKAKEYIPYVSVGLVKVPGVSKISPSTWASHKASILAFAQWCQDNNIDEFMIGNEELTHYDTTQYTDDDVIALYLEVAEEVQQIFHGYVNYAIVASKIEAWGAADIQENVNIDKPSVNLYGSSGTDLVDFESQVALARGFWGLNTYISEWAPYWDWSTVSTDQAVQAQLVADRLKIIEKYGLESMYFVWKFHNNNDVSSWNNYGVYVNCGGPNNNREEWLRRHIYYALFDNGNPPANYIGS